MSTVTDTEHPEASIPHVATIGPLAFSELEIGTKFIFNRPGLPFTEATLLMKTDDHYCIELTGGRGHNLSAFPRLGHAQVTVINF